MDAGACDFIGVGKDHRAVKLKLALPLSRPGRSKGRRFPKVRGWRPTSETKYHAELDAKLVLLEGQVLDLQQKCIAIEGVLKDASKTCQANTKMMTTMIACRSVYTK